MSHLLKEQDKSKLLKRDRNNHIMKLLRKKIMNKIMMTNLKRLNSLSRVDFNNKSKKLSKISNKINNRSKFIRNQIQIRTLKVRILTKRKTKNNSKKLLLHLIKVTNLTKRCFHK